MVVIIICQLLESPLHMLPVQYGMYSKLWLLSLHCGLVVVRCQCYITISTWYMCCLCCQCYSTWCCCLQHLDLSEVLYNWFKFDFRVGHGQMNILGHFLGEVG